MKQRLLDRRVFGVDPSNPDSPGRLGIAYSFEDLMSALGRTEGPVDPRTGRPLDPSGVYTIQFHSDEGHLIDMQLSEDPVKSISFSKPSPRDVLQVVDAFSDLAPFGIWCDVDERFFDPALYDSYR